MQKPLILYHAHRLSQCCRVKISDPYYPFGEIYSCASWNHGTVSANPNYIWWPANQWKLPEYSLLFLPQAEREQKVMTSPPPPQSWPTEEGWEKGEGEGGVGRSPGGEGWADSSIETLTEDRHGRPALSLMLRNTGFTSLADKKWLCQWSTGLAWLGGYCEGHWNSLPSR